MPSDHDADVLIAGAGLAGALLAVMLGSRGQRVILCERRDDPRTAGYAGGRSINLALSVRGLTALRTVGLEEAVLRDAIPMRGRMIHDAGGETTFQPYSKDSRDAINSVSRGRLNLTLLEAAAALDTVTLRFGMRCTDVDLDTGAATFIDDQNREVDLRGRLLIGADGAFSAVRQRMQKQDRFEYSQSYLAHGYRELCFPAADDRAFAMPPDALHIWPRGGSMMIALPNADRTFTGTLFWPLADLEAARSDEEIMSLFRRIYPDAVPLLPNLVREFRENPTGSLVTVRCHPWHHEDRIVLVGDAAHAIVPFFGQGMNAAFEDCRVLCELLDASGGGGSAGGGGNAWAKVLPAYTKSRKPNGDAIADLALDNFTEMRDHVGSKLFRARKRFATLLHRLMPTTFMPLYNMVSFSNVPYAEAQRLAQVRARNLRTIGWSAGLFLIMLLVAIIARSL